MIDKKKYLNPSTVARLGNIKLRARMAVEGYLAGQHKSPYHGFSVEFAEHRSYGTGDEIRHIDWKLYAKTDRFYVKRFEEETNLRSYIILDTSKSMDYGSGSITKLNYAIHLSAALTHLMLAQRDGMGLILFDEKINKFIPPRASPSHANYIMSALGKILTGSDTKIKPTLDRMAEKIKKRGMVIVISDLLDEPSEVLMGLNHFRHNKQEIIVFHIIDKEEKEFSFSSRTKFKDLETGELITTDPWHIRSDYINNFNSIQKIYKKGCRNQKIDYVPLYTNNSLNDALGQYLKKRQKIS